MLKTQAAPKNTRAVREKIPDFFMVPSGVVMTPRSGCRSVFYDKYFMIKSRDTKYGGSQKSEALLGAFAHGFLKEDRVCMQDGYSTKLILVLCHCV
jgi:hypothetical protein